MFENIPVCMVIVDFILLMGLTYLLADKFIKFPELLDEDEGDESISRVWNPHIKE